jgi:hypothetical protein
MLLPDDIAQIVRRVNLDVGIASYDPRRRHTALDYLWPIN